MIFRITFRDNDFRNILENIGNNMLSIYSYYRMTRLANKDDNESIKEYVDNSKLQDQLLYKLSDEKEFTNTEKALLITLLNKSIKAYIEDNTSKENAEYLINNLDISLQETIDSKFENDEVLYYFPIINKYVIK